MKYFDRRRMAVMGVDELSIYKELEICGGYINEKRDTFQSFSVFFALMSSPFWYAYGRKAQLFDGLNDEIKIMKAMQDSISKQLINLGTPKTVQERRGSTAPASQQTYVETIDYRPTVDGTTPPFMSAGPQNQPPMQGPNMGYPQQAYPTASNVQISFEQSSNSQPFSSQQPYTPFPQQFQNAPSAQQFPSNQPTGQVYGQPGLPFPTFQDVIVSNREAALSSQQVALSNSQVALSNKSRELFPSRVCTLALALICTGLSVLSWFSAPKSTYTD